MRMLFLFFFWAFSLFAEPITEDYMKGKEIMQVYEKPALLCFLSSDGCLWSLRFFEEVLKEPDFLKQIRNEFIFVLVDFPELKRQSKEQIETNAELKVRYRVDSFPTFVMVAPDGEEITRLSFLSKSQFTSKLLMLHNEYLSIKKSIKDIAAKDLKSIYNRALSLGSPALISQILEIGLCSQNPGFFQLEKLIALNMTKEGKESEEAKQLRKSIYKLEGNELENARFRLAVSDFQDVEKDKPHVAGGILSRFLASNPKDPNTIYKVNLLLATHFLAQKDFVLARHYAKEIQKIGSIISQKEVDDLLSQIEKEAGDLRSQVMDKYCIE
jgi:thioredoxin-related protein